MNNFTLRLPTKIVFGKGTENKVGEEIAACGAKKVLVHFGGGSAVKSGLLDRVYAALDAAGIQHVGLGGVKANPLVSLVREGVALCRQEGVDFILAVGGGSVIDSAKGIAYGVAHDFDVWELFAQRRKAAGALPLGCILTIAAAGSEMSTSTVLTNDDGMDKVGYSSEYVRPVFAIMNPELTFSVSEYQSMSGAVDILMHTMERYFCNERGMFVTRMSEALLVTVMEMARRVKADPTDYEARAELMWTGSVSHNGLTGVGKISDFASHQLEHELSGMFDVAHGAGLSAVWGSWARYVHKHDPALFAQFAVRVMGVDMDYFDVEGTALKGIAAMEDFFRSIGMPTRIADLGVGALSDGQIAVMVKKCSRQGKRMIGSFVKLGEDDMRKIYEMAR